MEFNSVTVLEVGGIVFKEDGSADKILPKVSALYPDAEATLQRVAPKIWEQMKLGHWRDTVEDGERKLTWHEGVNF
jgi:hypothetical protein